MCDLSSEIFISASDSALSTSCLSALICDAYIASCLSDSFFTSSSVAWFLVFILDACSPSFLSFSIIFSYSTYLILFHLLSFNIFYLFTIVPPLFNICLLLWILPLNFRLFRRFWRLPIHFLWYFFWSLIPLSVDQIYILWGEYKGFFLSVNFLFLP